MFQAENRAVSLVGVGVKSFERETDTFDLVLTLEAYPRAGDCPEAAAVAEASVSSNTKASLSLKDVEGRWTYDIKDGERVVNLVCTPVKAAAKISGAEITSLKWSVEALGVPSERFLTLCRWHGAMVMLDASQALEPVTNSEPPLLDMIRRGEASVTIQSSLAPQLKQRAERLRELASDLDDQPIGPDDAA